MEQGPSRESNELVKKLPAFMEAEGLLPCSQEPATGPCPESDESSPHLPTIFPQNPF
jgi:hypothetical protein